MLVKGARGDPNGKCPKFGFLWDYQSEESQRKEEDTFFDSKIVVQTTCPSG
jgi:hypothetical protein